jgi:hypothetical protein
MHEPPPISLDEVRAALTRDLERLARGFFRIACVIGALMLVGDLIQFEGIGSEIGYGQRVLRALPSSVLTAALLVIATRALSRPCLRAAYGELLRRGQLVPALLQGGTATLSEGFRGQGAANDRLVAAVAAFEATVGAWVPMRRARYRFTLNGREHPWHTGVLFANQQPLAGRDGTFWVLADPVRPDRGHWLVRVDLPIVP